MVWFYFSELHCENCSWCIKKKLHFVIKSMSKSLSSCKRHQRWGQSPNRIWTVELTSGNAVTHHSEARQVQQHRVKDTLQKWRLIRAVMQKRAPWLSLLLSQLILSVLPVSQDSLVLSPEAFACLVPFTMILHPVFFSLGTLRTWILLEQSCMGALRELSLMQNVWQEAAAFCIFLALLDILKLCLVGHNPVQFKINTTKGRWL